jgi:hypothetical protein
MFLIIHYNSWIIPWYEVKIFCRDKKKEFFLLHVLYVIKGYLSL